ncbi:MAG: peptide chain release factor 1 [Omnitrophica bacterium RIFCSPLOWO2_12_FULL_44_17]|uniref:Peptide chain release factor 1 n=1 Tax=Candidatus Danuiimicrobium aquiferis TaxID=1801832 RepID=A0A1G1KX05_9BACT|nr:MAG: peptide chain release factor 1 [Omnitrophica bacterium RIFCSPHIGHO2_02_FULL_45_28]OGW91064.1 MAG: peptide chain release factor 1 [Omnitrophica bacterium RIFCSPHIGHO2_12_FULL_44_12]OGW97486.1 MAG: peptide chain release factor 1 [Omnitrophica bacterium RIFCSPLOWO2_12_FULL_44_17]OGX04538.1 MAG: peptide chain release factor 1 [Omnitrophica bacterium RIFCSPLOWO2_02_FULL_44_11]
MILQEPFRQVKARVQELETQLANPGDLLKDQKAYQGRTRELARLRPIVNDIDTYERLGHELEGVRALLAGKVEDEEHRTLYKQEESDLDQKMKELEFVVEEKILAGSDKDADRDSIIEIRAGTGGEEASLFARDLFRMYSRFCAEHDLKVEVMDSSIAGKGGFKEIIFGVSGPGAYAKFKFESGTHRVQRVPETEASGRIHTSAATVAVMAEPDEVEIEVKPDDLRIDVCRAGGPGGQGVNTTDSAVQILHIPTGVMVRCQDERSQHKNKAKAMRVLRARLYEFEQERTMKAYSETRKKQVGSGDRSEKIRTYNFPDRRVTDHRIGLTIHALDQLMDGKMEELIEALQKAERQKKLENLGDETKNNS